MASEDEFRWPPLESNPEVFTNYLHQLGLPTDWVVGEVFGLDEDSLGFVPQPVLAVILTYQESADSNAPTKAAPRGEVDFYMKQTPVLDYACGLVACLHSVLNNLDSIHLVRESILDRYYQAVKTHSPLERATTLESMEDFHQVHNSYAAQGQSSVTSQAGEVTHHFIAFVRNTHGQLIEVDGQGPFIVHPACCDILKDTAAFLRARLEAGVYSQSLAVLTLHQDSN
ncbi:hypothetical protein LEN26_020098 [Aphanomyces euteiches]|nr:hypothetical protein LEN26_020098 [Aphanomyces euteiches]KAH9115356.1 hypothetical protein AeMF1_010622 [Aphanomyces euteiches]KAH9196713.1 hypothetical protein AeNC1_001287 [Aphanomyces euteiches]